MEKMSQGNRSLRSESAASARLLFEKHLVRDFIPEEVKPFYMIQRMMEDSAYEVLGFYEGDVLKAYAFCALGKDRETVLLDYFAVLPEVRGTGLGKKTLELLKEHYREKKAILIETENIEAAESEKEQEIRMRRNRFYRECGVLETSLHTCIYGCRFSNWYLPVEGELSVEEVRKELDAIYLYMLGSKLYHEWVRYE